MKRLLIIGCGDIARRALPRLVQHYRVYAAVRSNKWHNELRALGVTPVLADLDRPQTLKRLGGIGNLILHFAPPADRSERDVRTRTLVAALSMAKILPQQLVYISTSDVYGQCHGACVSEERTPSPQSLRAQRRADAESVLRRFGRRCGIAVSILRVPGIYAADRLPLARIQRGEPMLCAEEDIYTNHIHADDLASIAVAALARGLPGRIYNAVDDSELKMAEYFDLVADAYRLPRVARVSRSEAQLRLSPAMMSFMVESRRMKNERMKRELGVRLLYPTVADGLAAATQRSTSP